MKVETKYRTTRNSEWIISDLDHTDLETTLGALVAAGYKVTLDHHQFKGLKFVYTPVKEDG